MTRPRDRSHTTPRVGVAVPAAGLGVRMGGVRKPFLELAGEPLLSHALRPFLSDSRVVAVVVALPPDAAAEPPSWITDVDDRVSVVPGGETRADSVRNAIRALPDDVDVIAVHDAARPLVTAAVISECIAVAWSGRGAVAGCPVVDTLKRVDEVGRVVGTPSRASIWHAHTPQVFPADLLRRAYEGAASGTDDATLVEAAGGEVEMVDGGRVNLKVTHPEDVRVVEAILAARNDRA